jgi:hypothetical protein
MRGNDAAHGRHQRPQGTEMRGNDAAHGRHQRPQGTEMGGMMQLREGILSCDTQRPRWYLVLALLGAPRVILHTHKINTQLVTEICLQNTQAVHKKFGGCIWRR